MHEFRENEINKILFQKMKEAHPQEINIIHILSFAPSGLSQFDLFRIANLKKVSIYHEETNDVNYGDWEAFLKKLILQTKPEIGKAQSLNSKSEKEEIQSQMKSLHDDLSEHSLKYTKSISHMSGSNVKSKLSINKDCWNMGFQILMNEYMQDIDQQRFSLQNTFKSYLKNHVLADKDRQDYFRGYLKYMSILSR